MCLAELGREGQLLSHFFGPQVESSRARVSPLPHSYFSRCQLAVFQENKGRKLAGAGRHGGGGGLVRPSGQSTSGLRKLIEGLGLWVRGT